MHERTAIPTQIGAFTAQVKRVTEADIDVRGDGGNERSAGD
jgi:hypothetical protein